MKREALVGIAEEVLVLIAGMRCILYGERVPKKILKKNKDSNKMKDEAEVD